MKIILLICCCVFIVHGINAQDKLVFGDTPATSKAPKYKSNKKKLREKKPIQWVKSSSKGLLIGNPCMTDVTNELGFIYLIQPKGMRLNETFIHRNLHNLIVKIRLTFKNGPLWKFKLKKWRRRCRSETSDIVG